MSRLKWCNSQRVAEFTNASYWSLVIPQSPPKKIIVSEVWRSHGIYILLGEDGRTPLMWAAIGNHFRIALFLVKNGADVNLQDSHHGWTALMYAIHNKWVIATLPFFRSCAIDHWVLNMADGLPIAFLFVAFLIDELQFGRVLVAFLFITSWLANFRLHSWFIPSWLVNFRLRFWFFTFLVGRLLVAFLVGGLPVAF